MAATIADNVCLRESIIDEQCMDVSLESKRVLEWKCVRYNDAEGCGGTWKESVAKRSKYTLCPECEKSKTRTAIVHHTEPVIVTMNEDCMVCCLPQQSMVQCPWCDHKACLMCTKTYILSGVGPARCMAIECNRAFPNKFLVTHFTKKWVLNEYTAHRTKTLIEHERSRIPESMELAKLIRVRNEFMEKHTNSVREVAKLRRELRSDAHNHEATEDGQIRLDLEIARSHELEIELKSIERNIQLAFMHNEPPKVYIQGCPADECRGLVTREGICELCGLVICLKCRCTLGDEHECDPNVLTTIREMKGNTKPCPKCAASIYKIDGCDQMFCTICHTGFSWLSGRIETGTIHNPHFFEWLRSKAVDGVIPRDAGVRVPQVPVVGNDGCIAIQTVYNEVMRTLLQYLGNDHMILYARIAGYARVHQNEESIRREAERRLMTERALYILGDYDEAKWCANVVRLHRNLQRDIHLCGVYETLRILVNEELRQLHHNICTIKGGNVLLEFANFLSRVEVFRLHINEAIIEENIDMHYHQIKLIGKYWNEMSYRDIRKGLLAPAGVFIPGPLVIDS